MSTASELVSADRRLPRAEAEVVRTSDASGEAVTAISPAPESARPRAAEQKDDGDRAKERDTRTRTGRRTIPAPDPPRVMLVDRDRRGRTDPDIRRQHRMHQIAERVFNVALAAVALAVMAPVMALIALAIRLDSPGPIFYRQERVGRSRKEDRTSRGEKGEDAGETDTVSPPLNTFTLFKFRSMRTDAESDTGPVWSGTDDERVTRVGRWLRSTHLDELPQFWNVLLGDMNVVGPRPERPAFVRYLSSEIPRYTDRLRVRPGITGLAQIRQGSDGSLHDVRRKLSHDLEYLRRRSIRLDIRILLGTPGAILRRARVTVAG